MRRWLDKRMTVHHQIGHVNIGIIFCCLEIPNDAYTTRNRNLIHCSSLLQADWLILKNDEKATLNIYMTYWEKSNVSCHWLSFIRVWKLVQIKTARREGNLSLSAQTLKSYSVVALCYQQSVSLLHTFFSLSYDEPREIQRLLSKQHTILYWDWMGFVLQQPYN